MSVTPRESAPGSRETYYLKISHDCGDATVGTSNFTVIPPPGLLNIKAEQMDGWRIHMEVKKLDPPVKRGNYMYHDTVTRISYLGFLPDRMWRSFGISAITPEEEGPIYWLGYQDCYGEKDDIAWTTIPTGCDPHPKRPAAMVNITMDAAEV